MSRALLLVAVALLAALLQTLPALQRTDQRLHDAVLAETTPQPTPPEVVLVDIDEQSLSLLGPWPWPRTVLAQMSDRLRSQSARLQVWDLLLSHPTPADVQAAASLVRPDVLFGQVPVIESQVLTPPHEGQLVGLPQATSGLPCSRHAPVTGHLGVSPSLQGLQVGHITASPDADGRLRRVPAVICHQGQALPQLALAAAAADQPQAAWSLESSPLGIGGQVLRRGPWAFRLDEAGWLTVPYARPHRAWPVIRAEQLLDAEAKLPDLKGKMVLVGATALGLGDVVSTARETLAPGVSVHAELMAAGLNPGAWPLRPAQPAIWAAIAATLLGLGLVLATAHAGPRRVLLLSALAAAGPVLVAAIARAGGWLLPAAAPGLAVAALGLFSLVSYALQQRRESQRLRRHLESFMPAELAGLVVAHQRLGESLGEPRNGVVLALRVPGIERWMAGVEPEQALGLLHAIHAAAQARAAAHGGRVDHAQGHMLLVVWPTATAASAQAAVAVAHACWAELAPVLRVNESATAPLGLEAAVEAGGYWVGVVGTPESRRPVVLGAAVVDVMAMLELHAELAAPILVGERASALLAPPAPTAATAGDTIADTAPSSPSARAVSPAPLPVTAMAPLGRFVLPGQARPKALHRVDAPLPAA
jgi:adenylate cyclase